MSFWGMQKSWRRSCSGDDVTIKHSVLWTLLKISEELIVGFLRRFHQVERSIIAATIFFSPSLTGMDSERNEQLGYLPSTFLLHFIHAGMTVLYNRLIYYYRYKFSTTRAYWEENWWTGVTFRTCHWGLSELQTGTSVWIMCRFLFLVTCQPNTCNNA